MKAELSKTIAEVTDLWDEPLDEVHDLPQIVNAILASDWLAEHDRKVRAEALREAERRLVAEGPPVNFELRPDGREDPMPAAYVEGHRDVWNLLEQMIQAEEAGNE